MKQYLPITDGNRFIGVIINRDLSREGRWKQGELLESVKGGIHPTIYPIRDIINNELIARVYGFGLRIDSKGNVNALLDFKTQKLILAEDKGLINIDFYPEFSYLKEETQC